MIAPPPEFTNDELERYSRQLILPEWSGAAQAALRDAFVMVIGVGALGSQAATYLVAAGVGRVGLVDGDAVELSNLHRQPLHYTPDIGVNKADNAARKLCVLNPEITVVPYPADIDAANAAAIVAAADCVVDCTDLPRTRYVVNDACVAARIPLVEAGVLGFEGLLMPIVPGVTACYRCAFPDETAAAAEATCREAGIIGPVAGVIGSLQALEAIKLLTGIGAPGTDSVLSFDGRDLTTRRVAVSRRDDCAACGVAATPTEPERADTV